MQSEVVEIEFVLMIFVKILRPYYRELESRLNLSIAIAFALVPIKFLKDEISALSL